MAITKTQLNAVLRGLPLYAVPTVTQAPYVATETRVGDVVFSAPAVVTPGYPGPLVVQPSLIVGGVPQALGYTVQPGDVGAVLTRADAASNVTGAAATSVSAPVTIQTLQSFNDLGYYGGNVDNAFDSNTNRLLLNAFAEGRSDGGGGIIGSNGYANYRLPRRGNDILADPISNPSGALTLSTLAAGSGVTVTLGAGVGTTALAGDSSDVGRIIYLPAGNATITAAGTTTTCTVTMSNTQSSTSIASGAWSIAQPPLVFGATSGSSVSMRITTSAVSIALTGDYKDVNKRFDLGNGISALVTAFIDAQHCTVTIRGGTLPSTTVAGNVWSVSPDLDSNGWPRCPSTNVYASSYAYAGQYSEGNLAPGTYHCTIKSPSSAIAPSLNGTSNCSISAPTVPSLGGDGQYTTTFDLIVGPSRQSSSSGSNNTLVTLVYNQAVTFADCPRDGSLTSVGKPEFYQPALAYYSQFTYLRFMDFLGINGNTSSLWSERPKDYAQARGHYSVEFLVSFVKAVAVYPGSKLKKVHICTPPFAGSDYSASLAQLLNTLGWPGTLTLFVERGNEQWNSGFKMFYNDRTQAYAEVGAIATPKYGAGVTTVASVVGNGSNVTVTMTGATLPAYITIGAPFVVVNLTDSSWNAGSRGTPVTVATVGANSFTYSSLKSATMDTSTSGTGNQCAFYFNLADPSGTISLLTDGNFNLFQQVGKFHARAQFLNWNAWKAYRPQDKFLISSQFGAGNSTPTVSFSALLNGGDATWAYGAVVAPYIQPPAYKGTTTLTLSAISGTGVTATMGAVQAGVLYGNSNDVGRVITLPNNGNNGVSATITAFGTTTTCTVTVNGTAASTSVAASAWTIDYYIDDLMAQFTTSTQGLLSGLRYHVAYCKSYNLHPMCYEGGPDFTYITNHALVYQAVRDSRLAAVNQLLWTSWLQAGGEDWAHYQVSPSSFGYWSALETLDDISSPKLLGMQAAVATGVSFAEATAADSTNIQSTSGGQYNATTGVLYSYTNAARTHVHNNITINRGRRYKFVIEGTTNTANDNVTIYLDGSTTPLGTLTLPVNGSASAGGAPGVSVTPNASFVAEMTAGYHTLSVKFSAGPASGYKRVTFTPV